MTEIMPWKNIDIQFNFCKFNNEFNFLSKKLMGLI